MSKNITFYIVGNSSNSTRYITIPKFGLILAGIFFLAFVICSGYILYEYSVLNKVFQHSAQAETQISIQGDNISDQHARIQIFADDINKLKSKLINLKRFEEKIRIIASIEKKSGNNGIFGLGGSMPDDINPGIIIGNNHNSLLREMHGQIDQLNQATVEQQNGFEILLEYLKGQKNVLASTPAIRPTKGWITSRFGYRKSPFTGLQEFHKGLDISNRKGTQVIATANGIVTVAKKKGQMGKVVVIDHGHGIITKYAHLSKILTERRKRIKRGDIIGEIGSSGRSTGPHLHYSVNLNGVPVNPEDYIIN